MRDDRLSGSGIGLLVGIEGQQRVYPIFAKQLDWMLGSLRTIAAGQRIDRAVFIAAPANAFGVEGINREFLSHFASLL